MTRRPRGARGVFGDVRRRPQRDDRFEFLTIARWIWPRTRKANNRSKLSVGTMHISIAAIAPQRDCEETSSSFATAAYRNKLARIAWTVLAQRRSYEARVIASAA
jgi:hypothetical protein